MNLSIEDKAILSHVVINPDVWVEHALEHGGEDAVTAKIERYRADYLTKKDLPNYMNRAERDAFELAQIEANKPIPTYAELRRAAYPPWQDYNDAKVKQASTDAAIHAEGLVQEQEYLDACLAVKDTFPKV